MSKRRAAVRPQPHTGRSGGQTQPVAPGGEAPLHDAVLQRVVGDHGYPTSRLQQGQGGFQPVGEGSELVVDGDADRLERAPCRVGPAPGAGRDGGGDDIGELHGVVQGAGADDGAGDAAGVRVLAVAPDDGGEAPLVPLVDQDFCSERAILSQAHVERPGAVIGEPSVPHVELMRRDSQVEEDSIDLIDSHSSQQFA